MWRGRDTDSDYGGCRRTLAPIATQAPAATATRAPAATVAATTAPADDTMMPKVATLDAVQNSDLGVTILVDGEGLSLYLFTQDELGKSNCSDQCADFWPPMLTVGDPIAGDDVSADQLGTIERDDGSTQVTYNGWPLYYFASDATPGDSNGQDVGDSWYVVSVHGGPIQTAALVETSDNANLGTILVDRSGRTQYLYTPDNRDVSNCSGICAEFWPPLLTVGDPTPGEGVSADQLGTIERDDGATQVTYNGWPLYYFAFDTMPGDTNGQDSQDIWYVVSVHGGPIQTAALVETSDNASLGTILVDRSGRTQYLYTPDNRDVSNCSGICAEFWPPLLTVGDPTPGEGVSADQLGTIERDDGATQVTYNGWPLYYFAFDTMPGDTNGQDSQDIWYVVSVHGGPIQTAALVETSDNANLGTILVDRSGRTQYLYTPDNRDVSNCSGICAEFWPPLLTVGDPTPGEGVSADQLGTIERDDGATQVTYNGWPLYYFAFDTMPGDTNGQDSQDIWYVVSVHGGPIQTAALVETSDNASLGTILVDRSGRTQYLYTPDNRDVSNCSGICAEFWPPLLTVGDPTPGENVSSDQLGTIRRDDGSSQVTYNGWPLYYFAFDSMPGDTNGQASGDVWYALSSAGNLVVG